MKRHIARSRRFVILRRRDYAKKRPFFHNQAKKKRKGSKFDVSLHFASFAPEGVDTALNYIQTL